MHTVEVSHSSISIRVGYLCIPYLQHTIKHLKRCSIIISVLHLGILYTQDRVCHIIVVSPLLLRPSLTSPAIVIARIVPGLPFLPAILQEQRILRRKYRVIELLMLCHIVRVSGKHVLHQSFCYLVRTESSTTAFWPVSCSYERVSLSSCLCLLHGPLYMVHIIRYIIIMLRYTTLIRG